MQMALTLAGRGRTRPNPMVGAVIVKDGQVVGRGFHARAGEPHAEVVALDEAGEQARGATLYVTLEPCAHHGRTPPCVEAVVRAGLQRVVAAMEDPNPQVNGQGFECLRKVGIEVEVGCLRTSARRLNEYHVVYHEQQRPFVTLKWAMSLCGRCSLDNGQSRWISNTQSREHGHRLRAQHDAVMVGIGTVLNDDPMLNVRLPGYDGPQPIKVVIDGDLSIPTRARLLRERGGAEVLLFTTPHARPSMIEHFEREGRTVIVLPSRRRILDLGEVLGELARRGVMSMLVEGGPQIHTYLLQHGLADKIVSFVAPKIMGGARLRSPVENLGFVSMDDVAALDRVQWHTFGEDLCIEGYLHEI